MSQNLTPASSPSRTVKVNPVSRVLDRYQITRKKSEELCEPLETEDFGLQVVAQASPPKWNLAHTTWFFETFLLKKYCASYQVFNEKFEFLFNSYYQGVGQPFPRANRGWLSRPLVSEIFEYRKYVDESLLEWVNSDDPQVLGALDLIELGIQHEQQHQELLLMDLKRSFFENPLFPIYEKNWNFSTKSSTPKKWEEYPSGVYSIGYDGFDFHFDNETPTHSQYLEPFAIASHTVNNAEYLEFMRDGGYEKSEYWLSDGWDYIKKLKTKAPLYWVNEFGKWKHYTLCGLQELEEHAPVVHLSFYEADAYAKWKGYRLPTEAEWEIAASDKEIEGNFLESKLFHPIESTGLYGDVWEWTSSPYLPYPRFAPLEGAVGEYNGKFMCGQMVLKGGCCVTPQDHIRLTYRNFYYPQNRWVFSGLRLAKTL